MAGLGASWTEADQAHCLGGPLERVADYMIERSGAEASTTDVGTMLLDAMEQRLRDSPLAWRPGAQALLRQTRDLGIRTALVSASWARLIQAVEHRIDAELGTHAFDVIVAGDDVQNSKPHPDPYIAAAAALDVLPADCLALEDSPTGVRSAVAAGSVVVAIPHIAVVDQPTALVVESLQNWSLAGLWHLARGLPGLCASTAYSGGVPAGDGGRDGHHL